MRTMLTMTWVLLLLIGQQALAQAVVSQGTYSPWQHRWTTITEFPRTGSPPDESEFADLARRVAAAIDCKWGTADDLRTFCAASESAVPLFVPQSDRPFFGLSTLVLPGQELRVALRRAGQVRVLHLGPRHIQIGTLVPRDPAGWAADDRLLREVVDLLAGMPRTSVTVPADILSSEDLPDDRADPRHTGAMGIDFDTAHPARLVAVPNPNGGDA